MKHIYIIAFFILSTTIGFADNKDQVINDSKAVNDTLQIKSSISLDARDNKDAEMEVFNLCGQHISYSLNNLDKGVYIVKQNGTSRKVVIR